MSSEPLTYWTTDGLERRRRLIYLVVGVAIGVVLAAVMIFIGEGVNACPPPQ